MRVWVLALLIGLSACERKAPAPPAVPPTAGPTVVQSRGQVWRATAGGERQPFSGGALTEGDVIVTGADGDAVVQVAPGRALELRANASIKVRRSEGQLVAELQSGQVVSRGASDVVLTVLTPFGITRVPGGRNEATIDVKEDGLRIDVTMGQISFVDAAGKTVTAGASEAIEVKLGKVELVRPAAAPTSERLDVVLSSEVGPLMIRRPGEAWGTKRAAPAPPGTDFRLGSAAGRARLVAPGLRARFEGGAAGRVGEATRSSEGRRFALGLDRGIAVLALEGGQAHELSIDGRQPISLRATEPTTFRVVAGPRQSTVSVLAGSGEIGVGETRRRLDSSERASIAGGRLEVAARPPAEVVLPSARDLHVYADGLTEVTLSWPSEEGGMVEVASDPDFEDVLLVGKVSRGSITVPAPRRGDLHWRLVDPNNRVFTGHARFAPDRRRSVLDLEHPRNLVSESGPMTTVYFQGVVPALTFAYAPRPGAARYRLRVYRAGELERPIVERVIRDTRCPVDANVLKEGSYLWHAVPLDAKGAEVGGGRMNKLELVYDNALTRLAIGSPKPNEVATGPEVEALGVAPLGSKLYINGKPARLDDKGRFSMRVGRASALVFRLVARNGSESYWIRKLRVRS
jgi:hypothetical protein